MKEQSTFQRKLVIQKTKALVAAAINTDEIQGRILVVGCGAGSEAGELAKLPDTEVTGIDIGAEFRFDHDNNKPAILITMDAQDLTFENETFSMIYSFHALEHIPDYRKALSEMCRVLKTGGHFIIGAPNSERLIGYIGSGASLGQKIAWNLNDLRMRLAGRWRNDLGAHAGFSERELVAMCESTFGMCKAISTRYYSLLYPTTFVQAITASPLRKRFFPCVYVRGKKLSGSRPDA